MIIEENLLAGHASIVYVSTATSRKMITTRPERGDCWVKNMGLHKKLSTSCRSHSQTNPPWPTSMSRPIERPIHIYIIDHAMGKTPSGGVIDGLLSSGYQLLSDSSWSSIAEKPTKKHSAIGVR